MKELLQLKETIGKINKPCDIFNKIKNINIDYEQENFLGHFHSNGQYRYGIKFYYGKLEKYNKDKLIGILNNLLQTYHKVQNDN